jgi:predicted dehydrogenase
LFIEKPLAHIIQLDELMSKVEDKRVKTYVACNLRFLDCLNFVKEYINDNDKLNLNELNAYCGSYLPDWRPDQDYKNSYSADPDKGGGVHLDLIHELDYIYWFFGFPKQITRTLKSCSSLDIQSVDYANYILDYDTFQASVILNYFRKDAKRSLELVFDTVTLHVDLLTNTVSSNNKLIFQSEQRGLDTYKVQLEYFMNNLKKDTFNSVAEALEVLKICLPE